MTRSDDEIPPVPEVDPAEYIPYITEFHFPNGLDLEKTVGGKWVLYKHKGGYYWDGYAFVKDPHSWPTMDHALAAYKDASAFLKGEPH